MRYAWLGSWFLRRSWLQRLAIVLGGLTMVALIGVLIATYMLVSILSNGSPALPFDSATWVAASSGTDRTRYQMHKDLLRRHAPVGMTRAEVTALLGPPTQTDKFRQWDLVYWMGPEPGIGVDSIWLVLRLEGERVAEHQVMTD